MMMVKKPGFHCLLPQLCQVIVETLHVLHRTSAVLAEQGRKMIAQNTVTGYWCKVPNRPRGKEVNAAREKI